MLSYLQCCVNMLMFNCKHDYIRQTTPSNLQKPAKDNRFTKINHKHKKSNKIVLKEGFSV